MNAQPVSALYWLPLIEKAGLPSPRTIIVGYDHPALVGMIEGETDYSAWPQIVETIWEAVQVVGPPAFVRTDLASAKHDGPTSYKVIDKDGLVEALSWTCQDNEIKFWMQGPTPQAFLVRRWLNLPAPFVGFRGHPIAREWRIFASQADGVVCSHFYWPEDALEDHVESEGWQVARDQMESERYPVELLGMAHTAARVCDAVSNWSVDFAADDEGRWWLIDMAPAELSWHPEHD